MSKVVMARELRLPFKFVSETIICLKTNLFEAQISQIWKIQEVSMVTVSLKKRVVGQYKMQSRMLIKRCRWLRVIPLRLSPYRILTGFRFRVVDVESLLLMTMRICGD